MRILGTIQNKEFKITVFTWNERYIAKFEAGAFEQVYKFPASLFEHWEDMGLLFDDNFMENVRLRFTQMVADCEASYKRISESQQNKNAPL